MEFRLKKQSGNLPNLRVSHVTQYLFTFKPLFISVSLDIFTAII